MITKITDEDLERHAKWLDGKGGGVRIVVESGADLRRANLQGANRLITVVCPIYPLDATATTAGRSATMISEIGNDLVTTYGEACKAFAWFGPLSLRDMVRAENALVGFIAALESANAGLTAELSALRAEKAELDSGMHEMRAKLDQIAYERSNLAALREVM